jgi:pimeloyl-ACP methyl ester carboxylesterase
MARLAPIFLWAGYLLVSGCGAPADSENVSAHKQPSPTASVISSRTPATAHRVATPAPEVSCDPPAFFELAIPLADGGYRDHDILRECNRILGTAYDVEERPNFRRQFTEAHRIALRLAGTVAGIEFDEQPGKLILRIPNGEHPIARRKQREKIAELFGLKDDWPKDKGLHVPADFSPHRPTILLIHGLFSGREELKRLDQAFQSSGFQTLTFDYPNVGSIGRSGDRLHEELEALAAKYPGLKVCVVAHSMGGLVARHCVQTWPGGQMPITHLVTLGTPHRGSSLTGAHSWVKAYFHLVEGKSLTDSIQAGLDEAAADLRPGSLFLNCLNSSVWPSTVRIFTVAGKRPFLDEAQRAEAQQRLVNFMSQRQASPEKIQAVQDFFEGPELQPGKGDGAVAVNSALLSDAQQRRIFDANHLDLLHLPGDRPEDHEVFQWILDCLNEK